MKITSAILLVCTSAACAPSPTAPRTVEERAEIELVESAPIETSLDHPDIRNAADVWLEMIEHATRTLDFAEFYASESESPPSALTPIISSVVRAQKRGVRVRFLADATFASKYPATLAEFERNGIAVRKIDMEKRAGGILHAKYFIVDGRETFIGSQNFDWRALSHVQEIGLRVGSTRAARDALDLFETDWALAAGGEKVLVRTHGVERLRTSNGDVISLVASPKAWLPDESTWELPRLVALVDGARAQVDVQVLAYKRTEHDDPAFVALDDALRRAAYRGVRVRLLISEWGANPKSEGMKSIASLAEAGVAVRVLTIPRWSGGEIPFARVSHAKYMVVDSAAAPHAWIGSSNWESRYFVGSRNVGVIVDGPSSARTLERVFTDGWNGPYAKPLELKK